MSTLSISDNIQHLTTSLKQTFSLIAKLSSLQPSTALPESTTSPSSTSLSSSSAIAPEDTISSLDDLRIDLGSEIADLLKSHEEDLESLLLDVEDLSATLPSFKSGSSSATNTSERLQKRRNEIDKLNASCAKLVEDLRLARTRFRHATLRAKRNIDVAIEKEQREYLASLRAAGSLNGLPNDNDSTSNDAPGVGEEGEQQQQQQQQQKNQSLSAMQTSFFARRNPKVNNQHTSQRTQDDILLTTQTDITTSLKRTHALLSTSLEQASFARESLETSNAAMAELSERYSSVDELLKKSKGLLSTLLRSQKSDTWFLQTALWILMGTLGWLIFRRLFWGPVSLLIIWPLKLIYSVFSVLITSLLNPILGGKSALSSQILSSSSLSGSRTSLRVMPSASGKPPPFPEHMRRPGGVYMPAGAGGAGAKEVPENQEQRRQYSEMIGNMVDEASAVADLTSVVGTGMVAQASQGVGSQGGNEQSQSGNGGDRSGRQEGGVSGDQDGQVAAGGQQQQQRGDGQNLPVRDEATQPRNPKKRMMEVPPDSEGSNAGEQRRDEL